MAVNVFRDDADEGRTSIQITKATGLWDPNNECEVHAFVWEIEYRDGRHRAIDDTVTLAVTHYRPDIYGGATPIDKWTLDVRPITDEPRVIEDSLADLIGRRNARSAMEKALRRDLWPV